MPLTIKNILANLNISPSFILYLFFVIGYFSPLNTNQEKAFSLFKSSNSSWRFGIKKYLFFLYLISPNFILSSYSLNFKPPPDELFLASLE
jgi:hypothetical protein